MCIAIPNRVIRVNGNLGKVDMGDGTFNVVDISLVDVKEGDYVIVQMGFAIQVLNEEEAQESLNVWRSLLQKDDTND